MENYNLEQEWIALSTPWIKESREGKNSNRTGLLDIYMLDECGEVKGLTILDSGCGE